MIKSLLVLVCLFFSSLSYSTANIQVVDIVPGSPQVRIIFQIISWFESDDAPNPCYGEDICYIGPDAQYMNGTTYEKPSLHGTCQNGNCIEISKLKTAKEVMEKYERDIGIPMSGYFDTTNHNGIGCVTLFYTNRQPAVGNTSNVEIWPGAICGNIPPLTLVCSVDPIADLDHGEVSISELQNGNIVLSPIVVATSRCNQDATFTMYATSKDGSHYIPLNAEETLLSEILINGVSGINGAPYSVKANQDTQVTFQSKLFTRGEIIPGDYEGVAVITAAYK